MIGDNLASALNEQMNVERQNQAVYLQLGAILDNLNWEGSAKWMYKSAGEEFEHFGKFKDWLIVENQTPQLTALEPVNLLGNAPDDIIAYFEAALKLEQETTAKINELYKLAEGEDGATCVFLHWFLTEQAESEISIIDILQVLKRLDRNGQVLWDLELE